MRCSRGQASPNDITKKRLWAASGGYCQNPGCTTELFRDTGSKTVHIAEMAHIIAAANRGPRADASKSAAEKGAFENLVMLCTACHTMIDQAPADFPDALIVQWKYEHTEKLKAIFGVVRCASRQEARAFITPLLAENHAIFEDCGPHKAIGGLADLELASKWLVRMRTNIIPNNRKALAILDANRDLLSEDECQILEQFRLHTEDLEARHLTDTITGGQRRFPDDMATILVGER